MTAPGSIANDIPKIRARGLFKRFGAKQVLDGLDLDIARGESVCVIGGSGQGKSVLLKCILGLVTPEQGSIEIDGEETVGINEAGRERISANLGMLFQGAALFDSLPIWENVGFGLLAAKKVNRAQARDVARAKLALVGMGDDMLDRFPASLSIGMKKRVGLARAIAADPDVIFYDEPTTGLDPIMADVINDLIVKVNQETHATTLTITHDMASARKIADRVAMLYQGKITWAGPTRDLDDCANPVVAQFILGQVEGPIHITGRE